MIHRVIAIMLFATLAGGSSGADQDRPAIRSQAWQRRLDHEQFKFYASDANALFATERFTAKCQIHMIYDPADPITLTFVFVRGGKDVLTFHEFFTSVFVNSGDVLYFAHYSPINDGCIVTANNLTTGQELWQTRLHGIGPVAHSKYSNEVTMELSQLAGIDKAGEESIVVTGHETGGDYIEVLDCGTGAILAQKVFLAGN